MARDISKIIAEDVNVWLTLSGSWVVRDPTTGNPLPPDAANFTEVGWCEAAQTKLSVENRNTVDLHDNTPFRLNSSYLLEVMALETNSQKLTSLEGFENADIDIILSKVNEPSQGYLLKRMRVVLDPDMAFDSKTPLKIKLEARRSARKLSEVLSEIDAMKNFS